MTTEHLVPAGRRLAVPAVLVLVAMLLVAIQSRHHDELYAPNELTQLDYVMSLPHVPAHGEPLSPEAVPEGVNAATLPEGPYSFAGATPPAYYAVTAVLARPVAAVTPWSPLTVARAVGALWLAAFLLVTYALARALGVPRLPAAASATAVAGTLSLATSASYLGSDTAGAVAGGLVLLAACRYDGGRRALLWLAAACALAGLTKLTAVTAVGVAVAVLGARALPGPSPRLRPVAALAGAAMSILAFAVPAVLWVVRTRETAEQPVSAFLYYAPYVADRVDWDLLAQPLLFAWVSPVASTWASGPMGDAPNTVLTWVVGAFLVLGALAAALGSASRTLVGLGAGLLVVAVAGPFAFMEADLVINGLVMPAESRYAYALLPGLTATAAWLARDRAAAWAMVMLSALCAVNLLS